MKKYIAKLEVVEALQFDGSNKDEIKEFAGDDDTVQYSINQENLFKKDYWLIKRNGAVRILKPELFEKIYDELPEALPEAEITSEQISEVVKRVQ